MSAKGIILFDGDCLFCNKSVQFILKRDKREIFQFAPLQGETAARLIFKHQIPEDIDSLILVREKHVYTASSAVLNICKLLPGFFQWLYLFIIIPKPIRDSLYTFVADKRHKLMNQTACILPTAEQRMRFLK